MMGYRFDLPAVECEPDHVATALDRVAFCAKALSLALILWGLLAWGWLL